jgi:hypothetical protein
MSDKRAELGRHLRLVRGRRDGDDCRRHNAEVFRIEQEILAVLVDAKRAMMFGVAKVVEDRLAPVDAHAARVFLDEIARGELP